ncbi:hypothetical protein D3C87_1447760 [compost metagenome]
MLFIGGFHFCRQVRLKALHRSITQISRVNKVGNGTDIKRKICLIVFDQHDWHIKCDAHSKFEHYVWISSAHVTYDDVIGVQIADNACLDYG